ncbi:SGNH hydrolase-type esterase domain-containing protein [Mariannaea sp. PMI_226]|nr:SGNH hydrolase-type esterase domain-containing protein [Mariannaea sp. PMI_226]
MRLSVLFALLSQALATPTLQSKTISERGIPLKFILAHFGDSFSAGIGAGNFLKDKTDDGPVGPGHDLGRNNQCARMTGSYPNILAGGFNRDGLLTDWQFMSCSGDVMDNIDGQVAKMLGTRAHVATLSISGNDFNFASVVRYCVYPKRDSGGDTAAQARCNQELQKAANAINNNDNWAKYQSKVNLILNSMSDKGVLYITGYTKFFSPDMSSGDSCDKQTFFKSYWLSFLFGVLNMRRDNRASINSLVDQVNQKMSEAINQMKAGIPQNTKELVFVDIDPMYQGHRFCEPGKDPWGVQDDDVWFNDLSTQLEETGDWQGPANQEDLWAPEPPQDQEDLRGAWDKFQQSSVFHPKKYGHQLVADYIRSDMMNRFNNDAKSETNFHVRKGCVYVGDILQCEGSDALKVTNDQSTEETTITIYAKFPDNTVDYMVTPGCQLEAKFPINYGDIYFGEDNCLYDASNNQINGQCCQAPATKQFKNPYFDHLFGPRTKCAAGDHDGISGQIINMQCVQIWVDHKTDSGSADAEYKPQSPNHCDGKCWSWPAGFGGIKAMGDGTYGTNCAYFRDETCQDKIGETGNQRGEKGVVLRENDVGHSVQCYFHC